MPKIPTGLLKSRSRDINFLQRLFDTFIISSLFQIFANQGFEVLNVSFLSTIIINSSILNYFKLYESYREKIILNIFFKIILISFSSTFISILIYSKADLIKDFEIIVLLLLTNLYLNFHHIIVRYFLRYLRRKGYNSRNIILFGSKNAYNYIIKELENYPWLGYKIKYWFSPNKIDYEKTEGDKLETQNCLGGFNEMKEIMMDKNLDKLLFCHSDNDDFSFEEVLKILGDFCIPVSYVVDWNRKYMSLEKEYIGDIVSLNVWNPSNLIINKEIKRIFDLFFSLIIFFTILPILLFISLIIKISSHGPILYTQDRYGLNGSVFKMYKFRTMFYEKKPQNKKYQQATINDKRVTKVGRILRKYSLDELPQLINVIRGEMSLVGPRPHPIDLNEYYRKIITGYMQRHSRLPGMTGLAQISNARGETKNLEQMHLRINYDLQYINNWSLIKDFQILIRTFFCILKGDAY